MCWAHAPPQSGKTAFLNDQSTSSSCTPPHSPRCGLRRLPLSSMDIRSRTGLAGLNLQDPVQHHAPTRPRSSAPPRSHTIRTDWFLQIPSARLRDAYPNVRSFSVGKLNKGGRDLILWRQRRGALHRGFLSKNRVLLDTSIRPFQSAWYRFPALHGDQPAPGIFCLGSMLSFLFSFLFFFLQPTILCFSWHPPPTLQPVRLSLLWLFSSFSFFPFTTQILSIFNFWKF